MQLYRLTPDLSPVARVPPIETATSLSLVALPASHFSVIVFIPTVWKLGERAMDGASRRADELRQQIAKAEAQLRELREQLTQVESAQKKEEQKLGLDAGSSADGTSRWKWPLSAGEYERYGRQLILPDVGIHGT